MSNQDILNQKIKQIARDGFIEKFGVEPDIYSFAPGRVNIIGEHTDYNDGFCLPCAIDFGIVVAGKQRAGSKFRVFAQQVNKLDQFDLAFPIQKNTQRGYLWSNYVRGVVKYVQEHSYFTNGADLYITGNLPLGSGLSSSAALEMSVARFCMTLANLDISKQEIALIGQKAENRFVGSQSGNMDQLSSIFGNENDLLMLDCRSLEIKPITLPQGYNIVVINSGVKHSLVGNEYNDRRKQCQQAADFLGVKTLRDINPIELEQKFEELNNYDPVIAKRAFHVVHENQRVLKAVEAIQMDDIALLSQLMEQSHLTMKNDFEITIAEIDFIVELGNKVLGNRGGIRMTGGGFGGCVVAIVPNDLMDELKTVIKQGYLEYTQGKIDPQIYILHPSNGAHLLND